MSKTATAFNKKTSILDQNFKQDMRKIDENIDSSVML